MTGTPAKVAWISCVGEKGGAEVTMLETFRELDRREFLPYAILLRPGPLESELAALSVQTFVLKAHRMRNVFGVRAAVRDICGLVRGHGLQLLHCNAFRAHAYGSLARKFTGIPSLVTVHSPEEPGWFTRLLLSMPTDAVIANCTATAESFVPYGWQSEVVWPGVNEAHLRKHSGRTALAAKYSIPEQRPWVTMCARIQRHKGQQHFLKAIAAATRRFDVQGVLVGAPLFGLDEDYLVELKSLAQSLGIADRVTFTGFVSNEDAAGFQAATSVLLHTALREDFGLSLAEANVLGVPAVAFAAVGPAVIIKPGETGWLAPVGDQGALDAALIDALSSPERLTRFGQAARERIRANFSIEQHVRQTEGIYRRLLNGPV